MGRIISLALVYTVISNSAEPAVAELSLLRCNSLSAARALFSTSFLFLSRAHPRYYMSDCRSL